MRGTSSDSISLCIGLTGLTKSAIFEEPGTNSRGLGYIGIRREVLALDPAPFAQATAPRVENDWRIVENTKTSNTARRALPLQGPGRNEQHRSSRHELPLLHSIHIAT